jgi:hypothetical protein
VWIRKLIDYDKIQGDGKPEEMNQNPFIAEASA